MQASVAARLVAVLSLLLVVACGGEDPAASVREDQATSPTAARAGDIDADPGALPLEGDPVGEGSSPEGDGGAPASRDGDADGGPRPCFDEIDTSRNTMPMEISVEPLRVKIGGTVRVTIRTEPDALIGLTLEFSDNEPHGGFGPPGRAAPDGTWTWSWVIAPDVPPGPARALVAAGKSNDRGATGEARFTVDGTWTGDCV